MATEAAHTRRRWAPHTTLTSTGRRGRGTERRPGRARESPLRRREVTPCDPPEHLSPLTQPQPLGAPLVAAGAPDSAGEELSLDPHEAAQGQRGGARPPRLSLTREPNLSTYGEAGVARASQASPAERCPEHHVRGHDISRQTAAPLGARDRAGPAAGRRGGLRARGRAAP